MAKKRGGEDWRPGGGIKGVRGMVVIGKESEGKETLTINSEERGREEVEKWIGEWQMGGRQ